MFSFAYSNLKLGLYAKSLKVFKCIAGVFNDRKPLLLNTIHKKQILSFSKKVSQLVLLA